MRSSPSPVVLQPLVGKVSVQKLEFESNSTGFSEILQVFSLCFLDAFSEGLAAWFDAL